MVYFSEYPSMQKLSLSVSSVTFYFLREISRGVFQNRGVCGQAFPLLLSPSPVHLFFFASALNFRTMTRLETLTTQAKHIYILLYKHMHLFVSRIVNIQITFVALITRYTNLSTLKLDTHSSLQTLIRFHVHS